MNRAESPVIEIDYSLTGSGWSNCRVAIGAQWVGISASYLSDALGDLARAVVSLKRGAREARVSFEEEPGEYRWILTRHGVELSAEILWFEDQYDELSDGEGKLVFYAVCGFEAFLRDFTATLAGVLERYTFAGYKKRWIENDFPLEAYEELTG